MKWLELQEKNHVRLHVHSDWFRLQKKTPTGLLVTPAGVSELGNITSVPEISPTSKLF